MTNEIVEDLLIEWELARQVGREIDADALCAANPELVEEVRGQIQKLKSTTWMLADDSTLAEPSATSVAAIRAAPQSKLSPSEFLQAALRSGILAPHEQDRLKETPQADLTQNTTVELAETLIQSGVLTKYQAEVLLTLRDGPLLLDRYVILDSVGSGGMGVVFKALHRPMERIVALKVLPGFAVNSPDKVSRFQREIRAAAKLTHPNIVASYDAYEADGMYFLVMEYVEGVNLTEQVQEHGPLAVEQAVHIIRQIAGALSESHKQGIVHRDIKPSNILLAVDGTAKLLDLGLARFQHPNDTAPAGELTRDGLAMGTLSYMSPEQALNSKHADVRSDVYSLGCTLYYLLNGHPPFERGTTVETIVAHREAPIPPLGDSDVPASLQSTFTRMLAKDPEARPQTMEEVLGELQSCEGKPTPSNRRINTVSHPRRSLTRRAIGIAAACLLAIAAGVALWQPVQDPTAIARQILDSGGTIDIRTRYGEDSIVTAEELPADRWELVGAELPPNSDIPIEPLLRVENLKWLSLEGIALTQDQLQRVGRMSQLEQLDLWSCSLLDDDLDSFTQLTNLWGLELDANAISDSGVAKLSALPNLLVLSLANTQVTGDSIQHLLGHKSLQLLDLTGTSAVGPALAQLQSLPDLTTLELRSTEFTVEAARAVRRLRSLMFLQLDNCETSDAAMAELAALPHLESLHLAGTSLGDTGLAELANLRNLAELDAGATQVTSTGLRTLRQARSLDTLRMTNANLDASMIQAISQLGQLTTLDLTGCTIAGDDLTPLVQLSGLQTLIVVETNLDEAVIREFESAHPGCEVVTDASSYFEL